MRERDMQKILAVDTTEGLPVVAGVLDSLGYSGDTYLTNDLDEARRIMEDQEPITLAVCRLTKGGDNTAYLWIKGLLDEDSPFRDLKLIAITDTPEAVEAQACLALGVTLASSDVDDLTSKIEGVLKNDPNE